MMSLRPHLLSAVLILLLSTSAALSLPSPLNTNPPSGPIDTTNSSRQAPPPSFPNVTFSPWPPRPYQIPLYPRFGFFELFISRVNEYHGTRSVTVPALQGFLQEFRDNLEREYPVPGIMPRRAQQETFDPETYTVWTVTLNEGFLGSSLPTEVAVLALDEIGRLLGSHGPASLYFSIRLKGSGLFAVMEKDSGPVESALAMYVARGMRVSTSQAVTQAASEDPCVDFSSCPLITPVVGTEGPSEQPPWTAIHRVTSNRAR